MEDLCERGREEPFDELSAWIFHADPAHRVISRTKVKKNSETGKSTICTIVKEGRGPCDQPLQSQSGLSAYVSISSTGCWRTQGLSNRGTSASRRPQDVCVGRLNQTLPVRKQVKNGVKCVQPIFSRLCSTLQVKTGENQKRAVIHNLS